ncbi:hypothetical protein [Agarilytica rhodophyticola]|uniref:hypothetical protein n=1 Tax=Agarilytica rhodophyticola TaxID=1737490 RepID=UPI000B347277|nr:hypothetical protein [Agarilytica rhodophyticola]
MFVQSRSVGTYVNNSIESANANQNEDSWAPDLPLNKTQAVESLRTRKPDVSIDDMSQLKSLVRQPVVDAINKNHHLKDNIDRLLANTRDEDVIFVVEKYDITPKGEVNKAFSKDQDSITAPAFFLHRNSYGKFSISDDVPKDGHKKMIEITPKSLDEMTLKPKLKEVFTLGGKLVNGGAQVLFQERGKQLNIFLKIGDDGSSKSSKYKATGGAVESRDVIRHNGVDISVPHTIVNAALREFAEEALNYQASETSNAQDVVDYICSKTGAVEIKCASFIKKAQDQTWVRLPNPEHNQLTHFSAPSVIELIGATENKVSASFSIEEGKNDKPVIRSTAEVYDYANSAPKSYRGAEKYLQIYNDTQGSQCEKITFKPSSMVVKNSTDVTSTIS